MGEREGREGWERGRGGGMREKGVRGGREGGAEWKKRIE